MQNSGITVPTPDPFQVSIFGGVIILIVGSVLAITVWVYKIGYPEIEKGQTKKPQIAVIALVVIAVLSPEAIQIYSISQEIYLTAMWLRILSIVLASYGFNLSFFFIAIPFTLLRLLFPIMVYRYYRSRTSRRNVIMTGVIVELPTLVFGFPLLILLIIGLVILWLLPVPRGPASWPEEKEKIVN